MHLRSTRLLGEPVIPLEWSQRTSSGFCIRKQPACLVIGCWKHSTCSFHPAGHYDDNRSGLVELDLRLGQNVTNSHRQRRCFAPEARRRCFGFSEEPVLHEPASCLLEVDRFVSSDAHSLFVAIVQWFNAFTSSLLSRLPRQGRVDLPFGRLFSADSDNRFETTGVPSF